MPPPDLERLRALLESTHAFPGPYFLSVITVTDAETFVALRAAVEAGLDERLDWTTRESGGGRYTSHRVTVPCASADAVLALYERVRGVRGVVAVL